VVAVEVVVVEVVVSSSMTGVGLHNGSKRTNQVFRINEQSSVC
jgi:hypothetical protein